MFPICRIIKKAKSNLGIAYWKVRKRIHLFTFRTKRYWINLFYFFRGIFIKSSYQQVADYRHIIICAHPDDETVFFTSIIKQYHPFVICMSNRGNPVRKREFQNALAHWGVEGCMFNMPDVPKHFNNVWQGPLVFCFLKKIAKNCPNLECVYTHNTTGESEHPHHQRLGAAVQQVFSAYRIYMTAKNLEPAETEHNEMYIEKQTILTTLYPSQYKWLKTSCDWFDRYLAHEKFEETETVLKC